MTLSTDLDSLAGVDAQVGVIGSGPVGASVAIDLVERGLSVVVLESGLQSPRVKLQSLSEAVIDKPRFHEAMSLATCRALGGTSWLWGGRCTRFEEINFEPRDHMPNSAWPISYQDISQFYPRAAELLGVGTGVFDRAEGPQFGELQLSGTEIWANETRIHRRLREFAAFERIRFVLNATVVDIEFDAETQQVAGLVVANDEKRTVFRGARYYVLALGGVETARLLLNVQAGRPRVFGGPTSALGRFYMGHVSGKIADIRFASPETASLFRFHNHPNSASRARLALSGEAQQRHRLPNMAFWPDNPDLADASHQSGFLSAAYLLLNVPALGSRFIPEAMRKAELREKPEYLAHLRNCIKDFSGVFGGGVDFARQRLQYGRRIPRWFASNDRGQYRLHYHGEQQPRAENRVSLTDARDFLGMRRATIQFDFAAEDVDGVYRSHEALDRSLRASGVGELLYQVAREEFFEAPGACAADGLHQIGTTRMAADPSKGVVDANCRVFGVNNLFIAGSSVFCSSGQANPTFPAVALGLRLAAHLEQEARQRALPVDTTTLRPLRILHVLPSIDVASGGPSRAVFDLALAARLRGHEVTICATDFGGSPVEHGEYLSAGIKVRMFAVLGPPQLQYSRAMRLYLRDNIGAFDIVHLHSVYMAHDWMVYRYAVERGIPYVLRPHGTFDPIIRERKRLPKWLLSKVFQDRVTAAASGVHYTSEDERRLSNCANLNAWVVPLPIRPEELAAPVDSRFLVNHHLKPDFILFLGRLGWKKGIDLAIQAFAEFSKSHPAVDFVIAGPDFGEEAKLRHLVQQLGLEDRVRFTGMLDGAARTTAYKLAKLFVVPSRGENFGRTVAEAMIVGTPVVMTDRIGIWKDIVHDDAACVVEADVSSISRGMISAWNSYPTARERASRAKRLVEGRYSIAAVGEQLDEMYKSALDHRRAACKTEKLLVPESPGHER